MACRVQRMIHRMRRSIRGVQSLLYEHRVHWPPGEQQRTQRVDEAMNGEYKAIIDTWMNIDAHRAPIS